MFALICKVCHFFSFILNISAVARVVGELRVGAAVGGRVPYVQVHVRAKWVEAGVLDGRVPSLRLAAEGGVRLADGRDWGRPLGMVLGVAGLALWGPDGSEETGHRGEAAGPREVWLWRTENRCSETSLPTPRAASLEDWAACSPPSPAKLHFWILFFFMLSYRLLKNCWITPVAIISIWDTRYLSTNAIFYCTFSLHVTLACQPLWPYFYFFNCFLHLYFYLFALAFPSQTNWFKAHGPQKIIQNKKCDWGVRLHTNKKKDDISIKYHTINMTEAAVLWTKRKFRNAVQATARPVRLFTVLRRWRQTGESKKKLRTSFT